MPNHLRFFRPLASINKSSALLIAACCLALFQGCTMNPSMQGKGETFLQGEWRQDTTAVQKKLLTYSLYNFKFNCDSFFVQIKSFSKVNYGDDTCMRAGHWAEYSKGTYTLSHDTVKLTGLFCDAKYRLKAEGGCFRFGVYDESFKISKKAGTVYQFLNTSSVNPFDVELIKRLSCNPKPL